MYDVKTEGTKFFGDQSTQANNGGQKILSYKDVVVKNPTENATEYKSKLNKFILSNILILKKRFFKTIKMVSLIKTMKIFLQFQYQ